MSRAYRIAFTDKNTTSLCLYSGPNSPRSAGAIQIAPSLPAVEFARSGWMGTGDANLKDRSAIEAFDSHYFHVLPFIQTFMLPHHGSIHNSDPDRLVSDADIWVAAAEPRHKHWEHPADAIRQAVNARKALFCHVQSCPSTMLTEEMIIFWNL
jgi:hypothetical protein